MENWVCIILVILITPPLYLIARAIDLLREFLEGQVEEKSAPVVSHIIDRKELLIHFLDWARETHLLSNGFNTEGLIKDYFEYINRKKQYEKRRNN